MTIFDELLQICADQLIYSKIVASMSATAAEGFFMKLCLRWGGSGVIWGGLSPLAIPSPVTSLIVQLCTLLDVFVDIVSMES